jgi:hypothetical protein
MAFTHAYKGVVLCHILIGYPAITRRLLRWRVCKVADPMIEAHQCGNKLTVSRIETAVCGNRQRPLGRLIQPIVDIRQKSLITTFSDFQDVFEAFWCKID